MTSSKIDLNRMVRYNFDITRLGDSNLDSS